MNNLLINCDLGEWEPPEKTRELMQYLDLANIACGGHAGSAETIVYCRDAAKKHQVRTGAHPGLANGGRDEAETLNCDDFKTLLEEQIDTYLSAGAPLHHIKLHGALYHLSEARPDIRDAYLDFVAKKNCAIVSLAGGKVTRDAASRGITVFPEAFLDRGYQPDGSLVPRSQPNAMVTDLQLIAQRLDQLIRNQTITSTDGSKLTIIAKTACVHSDSENSLTILKTARTHLGAN